MEPNKESKTTTRRSKGALKKAAPRSLSIAQSGIRTSVDFANLMSALMADLVDGSVAPNVGNATCNAGGKLLRIVELQYKYGTTTSDGKKKVLTLAVGEGPVASADHA